MRDWWLKIVLLATFMVGTICFAKASDEPALRSENPISIVDHSKSGKNVATLDVSNVDMSKYHKIYEQTQDRQMMLKAMRQDVNKLFESRKAVIKSKKDFDNGATREKRDGPSTQADGDPAETDFNGFHFSAEAEGQLTSSNIDIYDTINTEVDRVLHSNAAMTGGNLHDEQPLHLTGTEGNPTAGHLDLDYTNTESQGQSTLNTILSYAQTLAEAFYDNHGSWQRFVVRVTRQGALAGVLTLAVYE